MKRSGTSAAINCPLASASKSIAFSFNSASALKPAMRPCPHVLRRGTMRGGKSCGWSAILARQPVIRVFGGRGPACLAAIGFKYRRAICALARALAVRSGGFGKTVCANEAGVKRTVLFAISWFNFVSHAKRLDMAFISLPDLGNVAVHINQIGGALNARRCISGHTYFFFNPDAVIFEHISWSGSLSRLMLRLCFALPILSCFSTVSADTLITFTSGARASLGGKINGLGRAAPQVSSLWGRNK